MGSVYTLFGEVGIGKIGNLFQQYLLGRFFRAVGSAVVSLPHFTKPPKEGQRTKTAFVSIHLTMLKKFASCGN